MFDKLKKAKSHSTDYVTLRSLASSRSAKVRTALASNTNLQPHVLEELGKDRVEAVRVALANNPNVTPKLWTLLAEDESESVREALLETHPDKPVKVGHRS